MDITCVAVTEGDPLGTQLVFFFFIKMKGQKEDAFKTPSFFIIK